MVLLAVTAELSSLSQAVSAESSEALIEGGYVEKGLDEYVPDLLASPKPNAHLNFVRGEDGAPVDYAGAAAQLHWGQRAGRRRAKGVLLTQ